MRRKNWRFVGAGGMLLALAGGVGIVLVILGLLGKKFPDGTDQKP